MNGRKDDPHRYDDIIGLPHHVSEKRPQMSMLDRAAQFSPFAALTGYGDAVKETARITEIKIELDEEQKALLNGKLLQIKDNIAEKPEAVFTYFVPDEKKSGGAYTTVKAPVRKIDEYERTVSLDNGIVVPIDDILEIDRVDGGQ